jgi:hypothetical protein
MQKSVAPIFSEQRAAGRSVRAMAVELIARGVPTPTGAKWHAQTVLRAESRINKAAFGPDY